MENTNTQDIIQCALSCEERFARCATRMPTGCVEALRLCRERCSRENNR